MQINYEKLNELIEKYAKPRWEKPDEKWPLRKGGGEIYVQDKVLKKASIYISPDKLKKEPRKNLINTLMAHLNLLSQYEASFARYFIENTNEAELSKEFSNLLYSSDNLESRLEVFLKWAKPVKLDSGKKSEINAIVCSYFLAMSNPRIYPFCKPVVYNFIVEQLLYKEEKHKNQIQRIIHCQKIYTELLSILENQYGLEEGNLLDVHSLGYLFQINSNRERQYWTFAPGENAKYWNEFYTKGIMAIGWDEIGELSQYENKDAIKQKLAKTYGYETNPTNDALACYEFANVLKKGDFVFSKNGRSEIIGYGVVDSEYYFDDTRNEMKNVRKVKWIKKGAWKLANEEVALKTLTNITPYEDFVQRLKKLVVDELNPIADSSAIESYDRKNELKELFLDDTAFNKIIDLLKYKKNIILQGPPGVGKTFMARHLAWAMMEVKDNSRIGMVQFHQSYSYEDFIQGFRPNENGGFILKNGVFYEFCKQAGRDKNNPYFFIIDEINRGNISKIMGELMMLIEPDKRDDYSLPLTYSQDNDDKFSVPSNIFLIGTMNTADRSLAMVDYALRRRFCFINLEPAYNSEKFSQYLSKKGVDEKLIKKITDNILYLNQKISDEKKDLGSGFCIGHSYFCNCDSMSAINQNWYENIIEHEIAPLLKEYWFDNIDKAEEQVKQLLS